MDRHTIAAAEAVHKIANSSLKTTTPTKTKITKVKVPINYTE